MKILIIRFSSIGDIVLTTPVVRCLKEQLKAEIHYLTKQNFVSLLDSNPYIDTLIGIDKQEQTLGSKLAFLRKQRYDYVIDLHGSLRSKYLQFRLQKKFDQFDKLNFKKWLLVRFKINKMPPLHIVDRYMQTVEKLGVKNDGKGLDFFIKKEDFLPCSRVDIRLQKEQYICLVLGAAHYTKRLPTSKLIDLCKSAKEPLVLIGGSDEAAAAAQIVAACKGVINLCGQLNLPQSAALVAQSRLVVAHDTGFMHIAAAFQKKIISIWGSTVLDFGMYPYLPKNAPRFELVENKGLACRPCHKIGRNSCPKEHFKCMNDLQVDNLL